MIRILGAVKADILSVVGVVFNKAFLCRPTRISAHDLPASLAYFVLGLQSQSTMLSDWSQVT